MFFEGTMGTGPFVSFGPEGATAQGDIEEIQILERGNIYDKQGAD